VSGVLSAAMIAGHMMTVLFLSVVRVIAIFDSVFFSSSPVVFSKIRDSHPAEL